ncbi:MAG TPA: hypothetical protein VG297_07625 [Bryobacteraceae bacterium]|jgi:hypothetical protein|nr:hypothetical protein [Bryobacteraceae bacterium]
MLKARDPLEARSCVVSANAFHFQDLKGRIFGMAQDLREMREFAAGKKLAPQEVRFGVVAHGLRASNP